MSSDTNIYKSGGFRIDAEYVMIEDEFGIHEAGSTFTLNIFGPRGFGS
jgi:hypothetical protein